MLNKIKKYKKIILGGVAIFAALFVCYLIGQNIVLPARMESEGLLTYDGKVPELSMIQNSKNATYENQVATTDFPGGYNVGFVTVDGSQKAFLVTPGTAMNYEFEVTRDMEKLSFACGYHPQMEVGIANGAVLTIEIRSMADNTVLSEQEIIINDGDRENACEVDLSAYEGQSVRVRITCDPGENGDQSGDWIIVKYLAIE